MFGFIGAARTGKTTVAKKVAEVMGIHYHDASISKFAKEIGVNAVGDLPMCERLRVQNHILTRYLEEIAAAPRPAITDRTPLDMIGYMLGEVTMHNTNAEDALAVSEYVARCLDETIRHFDSVVVVRPLSFYDADPTKPPANPAYQWNTQFIIEGAASQITRFVSNATLLTDDLEERVAYSVEFIQERFQEIKEESSSLMLC